MRITPSLDLDIGSGNPIGIWYVPGHMDWFREDPISTNFKTFDQWLWKGTFSFWIWKLMIKWLTLLWAGILFSWSKPTWSWHPAEGRTEGFIEKQSQVLIEPAPWAWPTSELSNYISQSFPPTLQATLSWVLLPPMKASYFIQYMCLPALCFLLYLLTFWDQCHI